MCCVMDVVAVMGLDGMACMVTRCVVCACVPRVQAHECEHVSLCACCGKEERLTLVAILARTHSHSRSVSNCLSSWVGRSTYMYLYSGGIRVRRVYDSCSLMSPACSSKPKPFPTQCRTTYS